MVISDTHKYIFIACQKTGSTSIRTILLKEPDTIEGLLHRNCVKSRKLVGPEKWDKYFTFAFVRNPWDRQVSIFFQWRKEEALRYRDTKDDSFRKWIECNIGMNNCPCYKFIYDDSGKQLTKFIGRYENLVEDFNRVCKRLNIGPIKLPNLLNRPEKDKIHYREYYRKRNGQLDLDLIDMVHDKWIKDVDYFDYKF